MLEKTLPLLGIFLIGFGFKKLKWVQKEDSRIISTLLMRIVVPATILNSISNAVIEPHLLFLPLAGATVQIILLGIGFLLAPLLGLRGGTKGAFLISFPTMECGSIGYAVMAAAHYSCTCLGGGEGKHTTRLKKRALRNECLKRRSGQF